MLVIYSILAIIAANGSEMPLWLVQMHKQKSLITLCISLLLPFVCCHQNFFKELEKQERVTARAWECEDDQNVIHFAHNLPTHEHS